MEKKKQKTKNARMIINRLLNPFITSENNVNFYDLFI